MRPELVPSDYRPWIVAGSLLLILGALAWPLLVRWPGHWLRRHVWWRFKLRQPSNKPVNIGEVTLKPCGHCGAPLFIRNGPNAYGRCDTDGCWMHERAYMVPLDDQRQVDQWNQRASTDQSRVAVLEEALLHTQIMLESIARLNSTNFAEVHERIIANRAALNASEEHTR